MGGCKKTGQEAEYEPGLPQCCPNVLLVKIPLSTLHLFEPEYIRVQLAAVEWTKHTGARHMFCKMIPGGEGSATTSPIVLIADAWKARFYLYLVFSFRNCNQSDNNLYEDR